MKTHRFATFASLIDFRDQSEKSEKVYFSKKDSNAQFPSRLSLLQIFVHFPLKTTTSFNLECLLFLSSHEIFKLSIIQKKRKNVTNEKFTQVTYARETFYTSLK